MSKSIVWAQSLFTSSNMSSEHHLPFRSFFLIFFMVVTVAQSGQGMLLRYRFCPFTYRNVLLLQGDWKDKDFCSRPRQMWLSRDKSECVNKLGGLRPLSVYSLLQLSVIIIDVNFAKINLEWNILAQTFDHRTERISKKNKRKCVPWVSRILLEINELLCNICHILFQERPSRGH